jgi:small subunit ribosomal protein S16
MAVKIRLRRMGRTNQPFYRVVAADGRCANTGRFLETLGWYDPAKAEANFCLKMDRVEYWKKNGAILSDTVNSLVRKSLKGMGAPAATPEPGSAEPEAAVTEPVADGAQETPDAS